MALFQPVTMQRRPPYIGRAAVVSPYRGMIRVQAWPKKRGQPKDPRQKGRLAIFRLIQKATKLLQQQEIGAMREAIDRHNRTHRGQRGSAAIRFRDWQHQRLAGRGFAFDLPDGRTVYPPGVARTASHLLDHVIDDSPDMTVRGPDQWEPIRPDASPALLTVKADGSGIYFRATPEP